MSLLRRAIAEMPVHVLIGSRSDLPVARRLIDHLNSMGLEYLAVDVLSCHRNSEIVRLFAREVDALVLAAVGGKSWQLPAILVSWLLEFRKNIPVWGVPVGNNPKELEVAVSAMRDVPPPCNVLWMPDNTDESLIIVAQGMTDLVLRGVRPEGWSTDEWMARLRKLDEKPAEININLEEV